MVILDLEVLDTVLKKIVGNIKHQKDAQRNSVQKEVLNSSPSFFSASLVKKPLIRISNQEDDCEQRMRSSLMHTDGRPGSAQDFST